MTRQILEDIKVCDFSWSVAGPLIAKHLADYGAMVIKIENPEHPDFLRASSPFKNNISNIDNSGYFAFFNANKLSITLDLNNSGGIEIARRLAIWSDVVLENFTPGVMNKWELDYEHLSKMNSSLIMLSASGQGQTGPSSKLPLTGNWLSPMTGFASVTGWPDRNPIPPFGPYSDFLTPFLGETAIMAALRYRFLTGEGQYIDLSQLEVGIQFLIPSFLDHFANNQDAQLTGNTCPNAAPHGIYPCLGNKWCAISISTEQDWQAFCRLLGNPKWTKETKFKTLTDRKRHEEYLNNFVSSWTGQLTQQQIVKSLQEVGIAAGKVQDSQEVFNDPQLNSRSTYWVMEHNTLGQYPCLGELAVFSKTPAQPRLPAPCLGEHTEYVCTKLLNISDDEFVEFHNQGAFGKF